MIVGQIGNLRRIGNPPADVQTAAGVLVGARSRRINNPPQVTNLPHTRTKDR
jgi:hypothetical protein